MGRDMRMEKVTYFKMSTGLVVDESASPELKVPGPLFGTWGFSACVDVR
jgi:hypothetical protein